MTKMDNQIITHHGIKGQKWGVIRNLQEKRRRAARRRNKFKKKISEFKSKEKPASKSKSKTKPTNNNSNSKSTANNPSKQKLYSSDKEKSSSRLELENRVLRYSNNRYLSKQSRKEAKAIFDLRNEKSNDDIHKKLNQFQEEEKVSKALDERTRTRDSIARNVAKLAVSFAFNGTKFKYAIGTANKAIDLTDKQSDSNAVKRQLVSTSLKGATAYMNANNINFSKIAKKINKSSTVIGVSKGMKKLKHSDYTTLQHHGVKGQKWGVIRNLQEKRRKAAKTRNKSKNVGKSKQRTQEQVKAEIEKNRKKVNSINYNIKKNTAKANKMDKKFVKNYAKATKSATKSFTGNAQKAYKYRQKAQKYSNKSVANLRKAQKLKNKNARLEAKRTIISKELKNLKKEYEAMEKEAKKKK